MPSPSAPNLVGRDAELQRLQDELESVPSGGRVIGILGEPGIGKSALQERAAAQAAADGFRVLRSQGRQSETRLPYATLHQLLRPLLPHVDRLPARQRNALLACFGMSESTESSPFFIALAVLELLVDSATDAPLLVCLDDLQWMDRPSVDALSFVARRIDGEQIAMLCTARDALPFGEESPVSLIELTGLDGTASRALLRTTAPGLDPALRERIRHHAGGNPLALLEFAAASESAPAGWPELDETLPMTARLERAFVGRADELAPVTRAVLDVAALDDGDDLEEVLAAARLLLGAPALRADAQPAADLGLLTLTDASYRIGHPLARSALRHAMSVGRRREVHAALAAGLAGQPDRAVWHRAAAASEPDEPIAAELEAAALAAYRRGAVASALPSLERAAALSPAPAAQADRLLRAAEVGYELGRYAQVERLTEKITQLELGPRERSRLTWLAGAFHDGSTSDPSDILHLVQLARGATADADTGLALQLLIGAGRRVWWRDPGEKVRGEILRAAEGTGVPAQDPRLLAVLALCDPIGTAPVIMAALRHYPPESGGPPDVNGALGVAAFGAGDHRRATGYLSVAIDGFRTQGQLGLLAEMLALRAWAEINLGLFDVSTSADEAMRLADETGQAVWAATARVAVALVQAVATGSVERSGVLDEAERTALRMPNASSSLLAAAQLTRGLAALGADRPEPAYQDLQRVFVPTDPAYQRVQQLWSVSYLADAAVRTGRTAEARAVLSSLERLTGPAPAPGPAIALEYSRAVLADPDSAEDLFRLALDGAGGPFPWHRARLELAYGSWLRRQRRVLESRGPLRSARGSFDALGAQPWARRADHELRATGERGWRPAQNPREHLSPQEAQIAELAATGLSNREIGERLFLSHRTVSSHLYRIFPKLGVTSRGQLAAAIAGRDDEAQAAGSTVN